MSFPSGLVLSSTGRSHHRPRSKRASENSRRKRGECGARSLASLLCQLLCGQEKEKSTLIFTRKAWESSSLVPLKGCSLSVSHAPWSHCFTDPSSLENTLSAELDDADEDALVYLAHILPCLATCGITFIIIGVKDQWRATLQTWRMVDKAILRFSHCQGIALKVIVMVHPDADVPPWEMLPHQCMEDICDTCLPRCVAKDLIWWSCIRSQSCRLHDSKR